MLCERASNHGAIPDSNREPRQKHNVLNDHSYQLGLEEVGVDQFPRNVTIDLFRTGHLLMILSIASGLSLAPRVALNLVLLFGFPDQNGRRHVEH